MAASETLMIVGKIIMPKRIDAVRMDEPFPPKTFRTNGTITISPKKP